MKSLSNFEHLRWLSFASNSVWNMCTLHFSRHHKTMSKCSIKANREENDEIGTEMVRRRMIFVFRFSSNFRSKVLNWKMSAIFSHTLILRLLGIRCVGDIVWLLNQIKSSSLVDYQVVRSLSRLPQRRRWQRYSLTVVTLRRNWNNRILHHLLRH